MTRPTHEELKELTGAYVLGVLSDAERETLERHLATCPDCAREIRELNAVATGLAHAVPQVDPPAALRDRVLRAVTATAAESTTAPPSLPRNNAPVWLAIAASIAAVALGLYSVTLRQRIDALQAQLRDATARAEGVERELQIARASADRAGRIAAILEAPDVRRIDLAGQPSAPGAAGRAFWSPTRGLVFTAANLPPPPPGRQYQLWVIPPGSTTPISAGLLEGVGQTLTVVDPSTAARVGAVAVSIEPAGGVPQPTGDIVLLGSL
jgi:anti-sigma-K factor RskA